MSKPTIEEKAQALLILTRQLARMPRLTWVDANNAVYAPGGPFIRLFPTRADRLAFSKTKESKEIDELIDSLPEPAPRPLPKDEVGKFMVPITKSRSPRRKPKPKSLARNTAAMPR